MTYWLSIYAASVLGAVSDLRVADLARIDYLRDLQDEGADLYFYEPSMIHAKVGIVDDEIALAGSTNFDVRSFALNYECSVVIHDPCGVGKITDWYRRQLQHTSRGMQTPGRLERALVTAARLFAAEL